MSQGNLAKRVKIRSLHSPRIGAVGTADLELDALDMSGYEGVLFIANVGLTTSSVGITAKGSTASGGTYQTLQYNSTSLTAASTIASRLLVLDAYRPNFRYVTVTHNSTHAENIAGVLAIQYGARTIPTTNASTDVSVEVHGTGVTT